MSVRVPGGSASAKAAGLVGIVVHVTPEERALIGAAAAAALLPVKEWVRLTAVRVAESVRKKSRK